MTPIEIAWPATVPAAFASQLDAALPVVLAPADRRIRWTGRFYPYGLARSGDTWESLPLADPKADSAVDSLRTLAAERRPETVIVYDSRLAEPEVIDAAVAEIVFDGWPPLHVVLPYRHRGILRTVWYGVPDLRLHPAWSRRA